MYPFFKTGGRYGTINIHMSVEASVMPHVDSLPPPALPPSPELEPVPTFTFRDEHEDVQNPLKPLESLHISREHKRRGIRMQEGEAEKRIKAALESDFAYFSATYDLETEGERVQELQAIVDAMTADHDIAARVVIMNRGKGPNAFVTRDGTIFISQSLLNLCQNKDEIGAVLAHEINHLLFETSRNLEGKDLLDSLTLGWLHEIAEDAHTDALMVSANLNTRAMEDVIQRVSSGGGRDYVHMTGLTRAIMKAGEHRVRDTATSNNPLQELPASLKGGKPIEYTNAELLQLLRSKVDKKDPDPIVDQLVDQLDKLHGRDLLSIASLFDDYDIKLPYLKNAFLEQLSHRNTGELTETDMFFLKRIVKSLHGAAHFFSLPRFTANIPFSSVDEVKERVEGALAFDKKGTLATAFQMIYKSPRIPQFGSFMATELTASDIRSSTIPSGVVGFGSNPEHIDGDTIADLCVGLHGSFYSRQIPDTIFFAQEHPHDATEAGISHVYKTVKDYATFLVQTADPLEEDGADLARTFLLALKQKGYRMSGEQMSRVADKMKETDPDDSPEYSVNTILCEVFEISYERERKPSNFEELFEWKFKGEFLNPTSKTYLNGHELNSMKWDMRKYFETMTPEEKATAIKRVLAEVDVAFLKPKDKYGDGDPRRELTAHHEKFTDYDHTADTLDPLREELLRVTLKFGLLKGLHSEQDDEYYYSVGEIMKASTLDISQLSKEELFNLVKVTFDFDSKHYGFYSSDYKAIYSFAESFEGHTAKPTADFTQMVSLPWMRELQRRFDADTLPEETDAFIDHMEHMVKRFHSMYRVSDFLYDDTIFSTFFGRKYRHAMEQHLERAVQENDSETLNKLLMHLPTSTVEKRVRRIIALQKISDVQLPLAERLTILTQYRRELGPEGVTVIGRTITTEDEFNELRAVLKKGEQISLQHATIEAAALMAADNLSVHLVRKPEDVLYTTLEDPVTKKVQNTQHASNWIDRNIQEKSDYSTSHYDAVEGKIITEIKTAFDVPVKSLADIYEITKGIPESQRVVIALKVLADSRGLLHTQEGKELLARTLTKALHIEPGFVYDALHCMIEDGQPKLVGMLGSQMLAPLLFEGLDLDAININQLYRDNPQLQTLVPNRNYLHFLLTARTEEITRRITSLSEGSDPYLAMVSSEAINQQLRVIKLLEEFCDANTEKKQPNPRGEVDKGLETIITGIEASSPIGVRSLQLARQLRSFGEAMDARLELSLDRNAGTEKVFVWENIVGWMDSSHPELREHIKTIGEYLGGGSLFTTFEADLVTPEGEPYKGVVKVLNPNALSIIEETYEEMQRLFVELRSRTNGQYDREIQFMQMLTDMAHNWCLRDINDPHFVEDDQQFRHSMKEYTPAQGVTFNIPRVDYKYISTKVKTEERAPGRTLNSIIGSSQTTEETKRLLALEVGRMFYYQLNAEPVKKGKDSYRLVHSDAHAGNFMYDDDTGTLSVIDRSMYLRLKPHQCDAAMAFIRDKNPKKMVDLLIEDALDTGKIRGMQRGLVKAKILGSVALEYMKQQASSSRDVAAIIQTVFSQLPEAATPSLEMQLLFKNLISVTNLMESQGLSWDDCMD